VSDDDENLNPSDTPEAKNDDADPKPPAAADSTPSPEDYVPTRAQFDDSLASAGEIPKDPAAVASFDTNFEPSTEVA
jgi:hypothetical protein